MRCDLCGKNVACVQKKEIEGKEFELCECCWRPLANKLGDKELVKHPMPPPQDLEEYVETTV